MCFKLQTFVLNTYCILCSQVCEVRSVCGAGQKALHYTGTQNSPEMCGMTDTSHPRRPPDWWSSITNFSTSRMATQDNNNVATCFCIRRCSCCLVARVGHVCTVCRQNRRKQSRSWVDDKICPYYYFFFFLWAEDLINLVAALFCCQLLGSIPFLSCRGSRNKTNCDAKLWPHLPNCLYRKHKHKKKKTWESIRIYQITDHYQLSVIFYYSCIICASSKHAVFKGNADPHSRSKPVS